MDDLTQILRARILSEGPMSIAQYMSACLMHPTLGYYSTRDPFGQGGDFVTAPEVSQMFGELIGLCLAQCWLDRGAPAPFVLAELGPGRGTLMADLLRATRGVPGFHDALRLHLVEGSPHLRDVQRETLKGFAPVWVDTVADLPEGPLFLVANEFFDALPGRQFMRTDSGWSERMVGADDTGLRLAQSQPAPLAMLDHRLEDTAVGDIVEVNAPSQAVVQQIGQRIDEHGGVALIVDYGDWRSKGDTFQALKSHAPVDVLSTPGQADLTMHVDFEALAQAAPCEASALTPQGQFLEALGITARAEALVRNAGSEEQAKAILGAYRRLTHETEMGTLFKVLGLRSAQSPSIPGLT